MAVLPITARLYGTTRQLYATVARALTALGLAALGTLTAGALVALYVTGLVLLGELPTGTRPTAQLLLLTTAKRTQGDDDHGLPIGADHLFRH